MDHILLREIQSTDILSINKWRNDPQIVKSLGNNFNYICFDVDQNWFQNYLKTRDHNRRLAIVDSSNDIVIGTVQLTNIHPINKCGEFSIMIGEKTYWGRGIGQYVTDKVLQHGFMDLNLHRIYLTVLKTNNRAIRMYKKSGFSKEGVMRASIFKMGKYHDLILMSILRPEFK
jgi:UDP-4-amino-4,6-dideoxy-N-acetyl-beta-L-altrosamine N-acetyltransferase